MSMRNFSVLSFIYLCAYTATFSPNAAADSVAAAAPGPSPIGSCRFDTSDFDHSPFEFRYANRSTISSGILYHIPEVDEHVCIYREAACLADRLPSIDGETFECCTTTSNLDTAANIWYFPMIAFMVPYICLIMAVKRRKRLARQTRINAGLSPEPEESDEEHSGGANFNMIALQTQNMSKCKRYVFLAVFTAAIVAIVIEAVVMPQSIQDNLSPADRAAQLSMTSFLTPVEEVFAFIEDAMVVKVGYALAASRFADVNLLLHISVIGGAVSGFLAFLLMLILSASRDSAAALLNPSSTTNDELRLAGCSLIPSTDQVLDHARVYWLLMSAAWFPKFMVAGLLGFLAGTGQIIAYLFPLIVASTVPVSLWFGLLPQAQESGSLKPLSALAIAQSMGPWINAVAMFGYLAWNKDMRRKYHIEWLFSEGGQRLASIWSMLSSLFREGMSLMIVDLAVQLSISITVYVAASKNFETAYKIAAAQAAYWSLGPSYLIGTMLFLKVTGSSLVASGKHKVFVGFFKAAMVLVASLSVAAVFSAILKRIPIAFDYGESACVFASQPDCALSYARIFTCSCVRSIRSDCCT
jgi:hypothetical protein